MHRGARLAARAAPALAVAAVALLLQPAADNGGDQAFLAPPRQADASFLTQVGPFYSLDKTISAGGCAFGTFVVEETEPDAIPDAGIVVRFLVAGEAAQFVTPVPASVTITASQSKVFSRIHMAVPADAAPGEYEGTATAAPEVPGASQTVQLRKAFTVTVTSDPISQRQMCDQLPPQPSQAGENPPPAQAPEQPIQPVGRVSDEPTEPTPAAPEPEDPEAAARRAAVEREAGLQVERATQPAEQAPPPAEPEQAPPPAEPEQAPPPAEPEQAPPPEPSAPAPVPEPSAPAPVPEPSAPAPVPEPSAPAPVPEPSAPVPEPSAPAPVPEPSAPAPVPEPPEPEPQAPAPEPEPTPEPPAPVPEPEPPAGDPECGPGTELRDGTCVATESGGGCLIATAAYGTELAPQVQQLREIRDGPLLRTGAGSAFMSAFSSVYYSFSPAVADAERQSPELRGAVRALVAPMVLVAHAAMSPLADWQEGGEGAALLLGMLALSAILGMYVAAPACAAWLATSRIRAARRGRRAGAAAPRVN